MIVIPSETPLRKEAEFLFAALEFVFDDGF